MAARRRPDVDAATLTVAVDRGGPDPAYMQLYGQVRDLILAGRLAPGARLPSSRALAAEIGVSRTTIVAAYDHLQSEGYLDGRAGAGMYVPAALPESLLTRDPPPRRAPGPSAPAAAPSLSGRPFDPGAPDAATFPAEPWARLLARGWRRPDPQLLHDRGHGGLPALRQAIAAHVGAMRGIDCDPGQVVVTAGTRDAIELLAAVLPTAGNRVWVEDPGYMTLRHALAAAGAAVAPVAVDDEGFDAVAAARAAPGARIAVVTPSRQFPLGTTMSLGRRLALLAWARDADGWIVEDDYDSEYRYAGRPLAALMSLDDSGRVIYVGSFSKVMFRALRLGYIIAPPALAPRLLRARLKFGAEASIVAQPALAAFIDGGRFAAHIRRMRRLYADRQRALLAIVGEELDGLLEAAPQDGGMHLVALSRPDLARRIDDVEASRRAAAAGIVAPPLSPHYTLGPGRQGLLLGFACADAPAMRQAARRLAGVLGAR